MAAVQYARHAGAEIFATAGTEEKRDFLRLLGISRVFSSRTPGWADEVMAAPGGQGVDMVLNSLSGEAVAGGFSVLRPFGRFLELGKRDFAEQGRMAMAPFRNNISYFGIDLDRALANRRGFREIILARLQELTALGVLGPLPYRVFPASRAGDAFRHMRRPRHIGKIVIAFDDEDDDDAALLPGDRSIHPLRADGTHLVTGGLRGLGLETARWLARNGARHLALLSRTDPASPEAAAAVAELRGAGCEVLAAAVDVADEEALRGFLARISAEMPPLSGVVHAAMALDDVLIPMLNPERFWRGAGAKILGAWNLHRLTLGARLDFFILYSSVSTLLGVPGQAAYAAGNAFLESLARGRRSMGLPGTAIAWGAISDTGYLARNPGLREMLETRMGVRAFSSKQALRYLDRILDLDRPLWIAAEIDWGKLAGASAALARAPRFEALVGDSPSHEAGVEDVRALLATLPPAEAPAVVAGILAAEIARVMGGTAARIDPQRPLTELGLDSLMAVELLTAVETRFGVPLNPLEIVGGATLADISRRIVAGFAARGETAPWASPPRP